MSASAPATCWAISDGTAGNENQALALAAALGFEPRIVRLELAQPWAALAPRFTWRAQRAMRDRGGAPLEAPWPALAIGCGRRAALLTRLLRERSGGRSFTVQILDPRIDPAAFDVVVAPQHDAIDGPNVIRSIGALNRVGPAWLASGRARFASLGDLPAPRTAVLVGGSTRAQRLDPAYFDGLLERLGEWQRSDGGSFLVSISRRTPAAAIAQLDAALARFPGTFWSGAGENPYAGFLGWADRIVVTPDSVNMLSEAAATGEPVYTFAPNPIVGKLARLHGALYASGHLRRLDDHSHRPLPPPLAETSAIAELVRERWDARRGG
ncbi:MAG: mitochondrial fission ELM1 family protein [Xanthomonadales bacterium]|nr:mitochondrial fission ELM1 family protein [Xanthomonadales bacterium]